jgi:hypothetical protein
LLLAVVAMEEVLAYQPPETQPLVAVVELVVFCKDRQPFLPEPYTQLQSALLGTVVCLMD